MSFLKYVLILVSVAPFPLLKEKGLAMQIAPLRGQREGIGAADPGYREDLC